MRVNTHAHVFNLDSALSEATLEIISDRLVAEVTSIGFLDSQLGRRLGERVAALVLRQLEDHPDSSDREIAAALLGQIEEQTGLVGDLRGRLGALSGTLGRLVEGPLGELALLELGGLVSRLTGLLRTSGRLQGTLGNALDLLLIAFQGELGQVADRLLDQLDPDDAAVALMMDIGPATGDDAARRRDLELYRRHRDDTAAATLAHPGRLLPFVGVHPGRTSFPGAPGLAGCQELMEDALENRGFVGVKIYPALGYAPDHPDLESVYAYCAARQVPVMTHASRGGFFASEASREHSDPGKFAPVLERHPALKLCLGHLGGSGGVARIELDPARRDPRSFGDRILDLMDRHDGVFADISFHTAPLASGEAEGAYFSSLKAILADGRYRDRILWGTDYWLVRTHLTEAAHWRYFEDRLTRAEFRRIAESNPRSYLGLPDAAGRGASEAIGRLIDRIAAHSASLSTRPAEWLLAAVERRDPAAAARLAELRRSTDPSPRLPIAGFDALLDGILERPLSATLAADGRLTPPAGWRTGAAKLRLASLDLSVRGGGSLAVRLFNDSVTVDPDGVVGTLVGARAGSFDTRAWLAYRLEGALRLRGQVGFDPAALGLGFEAGASIVLTDTRAHLARQETTRTAVRSDLRRPRFALCRADVLRLGDDDALSMRVTANVSGRVTLSWADLLRGNLTRLGRALGVEQPLDLELQAGATIHASLGIRDDFRVDFARPRGNPDGRPYKVSVRRAKTRSREFGVEVGLAARFAEPDVVEAALAAALGEKVSDVRSMLAKTAGELDSGETALRERLVERLALPSKALPAIRRKLDELETRARAAIGEIAAAELTAGFSFEYGRLEEDAVLLEADLSMATLCELHGDLVRGDFAVLLERAEAEPQSSEVRLVSFLEERTLTRSRSWGFSFGLLSRFGSRDFTLERLHTQQRHAAAGIPAGRRITYLGRRGYRVESDSGKPGRQWSGEMAATTGDFLPAPTTRDLRYAFELKFEWALPMGVERARRIADAAVLWRVVGEGEWERVQGALASFAGSRPTVRLALRVRHEALARILRFTAPLDPGLIAAALAAAMPFRLAKTDPVRRSVALRREVYAGLWQLRFDDARKGIERTETDYADIAARHLLDVGRRIDLDLRTAAGSERQGHRFQWTFAGANRQHPDLIDSLARVRRGLAALRAAVEPAGFAATSSEPPDRVAEIYDALRPGWSQTLLIRAFGRYLIEAADRLVGVAPRIESSLAIEHDGRSRLLG